MKGNVFKVREGKIERWREWANYLNSNPTEVVETLGEENCEIEGCFDFSLNGEWYVAMFMKSFDGKDFVPSSDREINLLHRKNKIECLEPPVPINPNFIFINYVR